MKLEAMQLEQEYLEQRRQERLALLREEEEREKIKRQREKERVDNDQYAFSSLILFIYTVSFLPLCIWHEYHS